MSFCYDHSLLHAFFSDSTEKLVAAVFICYSTVASVEITGWIFYAISHTHRQSNCTFRQPNEPRQDAKLHVVTENAGGRRRLDLLHMHE